MTSAKGDNESKITEIAASLHRLEKAVLPQLEKLSSVAEIITATKMQEVEVLRALNWLQNKELVKLSEQIQEVIKPGKNVEEYRQKKLPETRFLNALRNGDALTLGQIQKTAGLNLNEIGASIGILMRLGAIEPATLQNEKSFRLTEKGKKLPQLETPTQKFFTKIVQDQTPQDISALSPEEKVIAEDLKKRGLLEYDVIKKRTVILTELGKKVMKTGAISQKTVDRLTPEMLATGQWKDVSFRSYDLSAPAPKMYFGKPQPYREFLEEVREKFTALGFEEMTGSIVESEFWNMDALFMPQFHSARDIHDAYYIKEPKFATDLPQQLVKKVKAAHENGFGTGSKGWRYSFDEKKTAQLILRSQTTACSARKLASKDLKVPGKYFAIGRCFRYDVIDAKHLADFNQVEGIVVEEMINLRQLTGLLKLFAKEFCNTDKIKVVPSYFPFTEPSASLYAKHPHLGWMELAGAGIFRPEMVKPLTGKNIGVLAWGIGIDRIAMFKLGLNDIRELFSHSLAFLRSAKVA